MGLNIELLPHECPEQAGSVGELHRATRNVSVETGGVIPNNSNGNKWWDLSESERKKRSNGKRWMIDVRKHKIKTDLLASPQSTHWLL